MEQLPDDVRRFYEERADILTGDVWQSIGSGMELEELPDPEDSVPVPSNVLEAIGYYYYHIQLRDNGSVYVFRANAHGTQTYGVVTTSDGGDYWLEVYGEEGTLLGAARMDSGFILWQERPTIRTKVFEGGLEPELLAARLRQQTGPGQG